MNPRQSAGELVVEVAVAAPVWRPLSYRVPPELAPLVRPLARLSVPLRGRPRLAFALAPPRSARTTRGLKDVLDVLDDPGAPTLLPPQLLGFFSRAAAYYHVPLGQALAWALPAGLARGGGKAPAPLPEELVAVVAPRAGDPHRRPRTETQAAALLRHLQRTGPQALPDLRRRWPRASLLLRRLEEAGWVAVTHRPLVRDLAGRLLWPEPPPERLSPEQQRAAAELTRAVRRGGFRSFLLYGVTGSGKTEVYLAACAQALEQGKSALVLAPEIGLVLRLEGLLKDRFGAERVAALHSGLSPALRRAQWRAIASGRARVVVGARSAVFAPLADPGVICVDEEQDEAYKDEGRLHYHARDLALLRGQEQRCPVVLASATPAVTTWHRARSGEMECLELPRRVSQASLPEMELVDLRRESRLAGGFLSRRLHQALRETVSAGSQALLFLNRRGYAPALVCTACGQALGCPACSVSLTLHRGEGRLVCHLCGHQRPLPGACPACGAEAARLKPVGLGTEAVARRLAELEPALRIARLDRDTAGRPAALRRLLKQVAAGEVDVVVGTQMITKGHHFPALRLVGVLLADQALAVPDFRAAERAWCLLTQVAGRAGRSGGPARVVVQTYDPHHHAVTAALTGRAQDFYRRELNERRALGYPPFMRLVALRLEGVHQGRTEGAAQSLARHLEEAARHLAPQTQILGPAPAPLARSQGRWRFLLLLKAPSASLAGRVLRLGLHRLGGLPSGVRLVVDVDPVSLV